MLLLVLHIAALSVLRFLDMFKLLAVLLVAQPHFQSHYGSHEQQGQPLYGSNHVPKPQNIHHAGKQLAHSANHGHHMLLVQYHDTIYEYG